MIDNDSAQGEAIFEEMRMHFDEAQIVEIGFTAATLTGLNLFNNLFGIEREDRPMVSRTGMDSAAAAE